MALKVKDVLTQDFVRDTVEEIVEEDLVYRQAFREISATDIQSNAYTFTIANDDMGGPSIIPEGTEFPRNKSSLREVTVNFDKIGDEVAITMEAQEDSMLDMKAREVEDLGRQMARDLNQRAFNQLAENSVTVDNEGAAVGDGDNILTYSDVLDGMMAVRSYEYDPDLLVVDLMSAKDIFTDENFNRATQAGDGTVRGGNMPQILGMTPVIDNTNRIGPNDTAGAFVIDSDRFGYELTRNPITTNEYSDPERQADVMQIYTRKAWAPIFNEAAVRIDA